MGRIPKVEKEKALEVFHQEGSDYNKLELKVEQTGAGTYDFHLNPKENGTGDLDNDIQHNVAGNVQSSPQHVAIPLFNSDMRTSVKTDGEHFRGKVTVSSYNVPSKSGLLTSTMSRPPDAQHTRESSLGLCYGQANFTNPTVLHETAGLHFDNTLLKTDNNPADMTFKQESPSDNYKPLWHDQQRPSQDCAIPTAFHESFDDPSFPQDIPLFQKSNTVLDYGSHQSQTAFPKSSNNFCSDPHVPRTRLNPQPRYNSSKPMFASDTSAFHNPVADIPDFETDNLGVVGNDYQQVFSDSVRKVPDQAHQHFQQKHETVQNSVFPSTQHCFRKSENPYLKSDDAFCDLSVPMEGKTNLPEPGFNNFTTWQHGPPYCDNKQKAQSFNLPQCNRQENINHTSPTHKLGLSLPNMNVCSSQSWGSVPSSPDIRSCPTPSSVTSHEGSSASQHGRYNPLLIKVLVEQVLESNQGTDIMVKLREKLKESDITPDAAQRLLNLVKQVSTRRKSFGDDMSVDSSNCELNNSALSLIPEDRTNALSRFLQDVRNSAVSPQSSNTNSSFLVSDSSYQHTHKRTISEAGLYESFENLDMKKSAKSSGVSMKSHDTTCGTSSSPASHSHHLGYSVAPRVELSNSKVMSTELQEEEVCMQMMKQLLDGLNLGAKILFRLKPEHREKIRLYHAGKVRFLLNKIILSFQCSHNMVSYNHETS